MRQPTVRFPLDGEYEIDPDFGFAHVSGRAKLFVEFGDDGVYALPFLVDSGASVSIVSLQTLTDMGIVFAPQSPLVRYERTTPNGLKTSLVYPHRMKVYWSDTFTGHHFDWPVLIEPDRGRVVPPLLGLGGVVRTCRWTFDGRFTPDSPYGHLQLEDIR